MKRLSLVLSLAGLALMGQMTTASADEYNVQIQYGGANAPWRDLGTWTVGSRTDSHPIELKFASGDGMTKHDGAKTLMGQVKYEQKEGMLSLRADRVSGNNYTFYTKKGNADWAKDGTWVIAAKDNLPVIKLEAKSTDGGKTLVGTTTYQGEGPVGFKATLK